MKKTIVLIATLFTLCACQRVQDVCACTSHETIYHDGLALTGDDIFFNFTNFQRIDSRSSLSKNEAFKNNFYSFEEMETYLKTLDEDYELAVYLKTLTPEDFENRSLYISNETKQAEYNKDCLSLDVMFKKGDTIYVHFYRNYYYKSMNFWWYQHYTFFIDKSVTFTDVEIIIDDRTGDIFIG